MAPACPGALHANQGCSLTHHQQWFPTWSQEITTISLICPVSSRKDWSWLTKHMQYQRIRYQKASGQKENIIRPRLHITAEINPNLALNFSATSTKEGNFPLFAKQESRIQMRPRRPHAHCVRGEAGPGSGLYGSSRALWALSWCPHHLQHSHARHGGMHGAPTPSVVNSHS